MWPEMSRSHATPASLFPRSDPPRPTAALPAPEKPALFCASRQKCVCRCAASTISLVLKGAFMKKLNCKFALIVFVYSGIALAQSKETHRSNPQIVDFILNLQEQRILGVAEAMPEEK